MPEIPPQEAVFELATDCVESGDLAVRVKGDCMSPTVRDGDRILVRRASFLLPGDVAVFSSSTSLVAHRVIGWAIVDRSFGFVTKGDHCDRHDGIVSQQRVLGRADIPVRITDRLSAFATFARIAFQRLVRPR